MITISCPKSFTPPDRRLQWPGPPAESAGTSKLAQRSIEKSKGLSARIQISTGTHFEDLACQMDGVSISSLRAGD